MYKSLLLIIAIFSFCSINAQTFNGTGGPITDAGATPNTTCFPVTVSGVGIMDGTHGIESVCLNITHTFDADLTITLVSPAGYSVTLSEQHGSTGDNYTNTCFSMAATIDVGGANAPFTGSYIPDGDLGMFNSGVSGDGVWTLCIEDAFASEVGTLNSWSITFSNTPAPPPPVIPNCSGNPPAGNDCANATPVCNFDGYCGNTSGAYTVDTWSELTTAFCGSIENNSFVTFVASETTASFNVYVYNNTDGPNGGIQMFFYDGGCGSGAVNDYGCNGHMLPDQVTLVTATGLTVGNTYYLMFDGFAGDVADYTISPLSGVNILAIDPPSASICVGQSVTLTASGGNGTYTWAGPNLNTTSGQVVIATPTVTSTYTLTSVDPTGNCPFTKTMTITITNTPPNPTVTTPVTYCQGATATALTATGTSLLWYTAATGGTGSSTAPVPSTSTVGTTTYYVTQTLICGESNRVPIDVTVVAMPTAPTVTAAVSYCQNATATALSATGTGLLWYTTATGGTGSASAPVPSTTTPGTTTYYVSQSNSGCEGPRAAITVTVNSVPVAPTVTTPVSYCQGNTATALTATGTGLLWYTTASGGVGSATAPTPSTATIGSTTYYVSQTISGCQGPRAPIVVTVSNGTPAPTVTNVTYCQGGTAPALTATGTSLLWYTAATGGTGSGTAPVPSTATVGTTTYYVTQTLVSCGESPRAPLTVTITTTPAAPGVTSPITYCQNATAVALTATGSGLLWYTAATGGTGSATAPVPSTTTVGNTTYYVSQATGSCEGPRSAIVVTINSIPAAPAVAATPVTYCQNATATALTATGTGLLWYTTATGGTGSATAPTPSTAAVGSTTYYVSQTTNACEGPRASITVTILSPTALPTVTSPVTYCQGSTATALTATGTGLLWYTTATGGTGSATAPTPSTATVGSTTYYVSQNLTPCGESGRAAIVVNVNSTPAAPAVTTPVTYCQGSTAAALTASGTGLLWYTTATGGTGSATAPVPVTTSVGNTLYYVSQTTGTCEGPRAAITVTINSIPAAPVATTTYTYCQNVTAPALTATGTGLLWYTAATGGTGSSTAPTPSTATPGTVNYYVSQTINTCESPRTLIEVTTLAATPLPTATSPVTYCQGVAASALTATGTSLLWYTAATGGTGSSSAPVPSTATAGSTTYYVTQSGTCGESGRLPIVVTVNPIPAAPGTSPATFCENGTATALTATGSGLLWYTTATGGTGVTSFTPPTTSVGITTYYVSQTLLGCESPRATLDVTIVSLPPAPVGSGPFTYCQGATATQLTATGTSLLWYTTATGGTGSNTAPIPSTATAGTFTYYVTQSMPCGESPRTAITVTVNPTPAAPTVVTPVDYCQGTTTAAVTATGTNLLWYSAATGGTGNPIAPVPSSASVSTNTYYVSSTLGVCEGPRAAITVNINVTPGAPVVGGPLSYCQDVIVPPLTATGTNLLWYTTATGGTGDPNAPAHYTETVGNTTYYVSQTTGVCEGPRASITVTINPYPDFGPDLRDTVCAGDSVNLAIMFNTAGYTYNWTLDGQPVTNPSGVHVSGVYQLEATNNVGCSDTVLVYVTIQPPVPAFAGNDTIAVKGIPHQLNASGGVAYTWSPAGPLNLSTIANPLATLNHDQLFEVTVTDVAGCVGKDKIFIQVYDGPCYYVPNAFSPNGDGLNDIFRVIPVGIYRTDWFRVFNRYGQLVFETNQWLKGWDGSFMGKKQPVGNYVWMVKGVDRNGKLVEMKGTVMIVQ